MAISNLGWVNNPTCTPLENPILTDQGNPSPAIQTLQLMGTYIQDGNNRVGFSISLANGYRYLSILISTTKPDTIVLNLMADSSSQAFTMVDGVGTSENYQQSDYELNFEIAVSGQGHKTYTFRKGAIGQGFPGGIVKLGPLHQ